MASRLGAALTATACTLAASVYLYADGAQPAIPPDRLLLDRYCVSCHNDRLKTGGLSLQSLDTADVSGQTETLEKIVRKLRGGLMPPSGRPRPDLAVQNAFVTRLEASLDRLAATRPNPGRTETFHRLNRAEYRNVVRDVLALDIDVASLLPDDSASYGFDNMAGALKLSESLMERYLSAARRISRAAVGAPPALAAETYNVSPALRQDERVEGLPFGTRGGALIRHQFPQDGEYLFRFDLANLSAGADLEVTLDGERLTLFTLKGGQRVVDIDGNEQNERIELRTSVRAGPHELGATFLKLPTLLTESNRRPFMNPTVSRPAIAYLRKITITGPFDASGAGDTPSRRRIFVCQPKGAHTETSCAGQILSSLARRAYRRPVGDEDLQILLSAYGEGRRTDDFEAGVERGLQQMLVSPEFLFRIEADPPGAARRGDTYRLGDLELASRLSFFLWSSVPDDQLLSAAADGRLSNPSVLEREVRRMLLDPRSDALTANFAGQWLQLRNLAVVTPSEVLFPDFDATLRQSFRRETELFFDSIVRDDRSALELLTADYTFLNDRLARHYGVAGVSGSHFRRVTIADSLRRGLLGQGSILTITSQPVRTSPVFRGKWILENILGTPPPPPPPNVPALPEKGGAYAGRNPSMRERMAAHRSNPVCASCHAMIDPLGFGLEQFDPVGRWREVDELYGSIDTSGVMPDGAAFGGVEELRAALVRRPDRFVGTLTEKLMTYALGRGVEYYDMPAVRKIVRDAADSRYRATSLILGIVRSVPFQMRRTLESGNRVTEDHAS